ncbi:unnamed protein product [Protopolystoma xenopodis]|uniref:Uncharacterized protein n=1 Tax=Protopolystoma xenopodis TaxID=117903 RepID=A0A448XEZ6_9PLAT|nr:unnamed protein product [Protopolystoma xenopodis]
MLDAGWLCHTSGNTQLVFIHGFYFYTLLPPLGSSQLLHLLHSSHVSRPLYCLGLSSPPSNLSFASHPPTPTTASTSAPVPTVPASGSSSASPAITGGPHPTVQPDRQSSSADPLSAGTIATLSVVSGGPAYTQIAQLPSNNSAPSLPSVSVVATQMNAPITGTSVGFASSGELASWQGMSKTTEPSFTFLGKKAQPSDLSCYEEDTLHLCYSEAPIRHPTLMATASAGITSLGATTGTIISSTAATEGDVESSSGTTKHSLSIGVDSASISTTGGITAKSRSTGAIPIDPQAATDCESTGASTVDPASAMTAPTTPSRDDQSGSAAWASTWAQLKPAAFPDAYRPKSSHTPPQWTADFQLEWAEVAVMQPISTSHVSQGAQSFGHTGGSQLPVSTDNDAAHLPGSTTDADSSQASALPGLDHVMVKERPAAISFTGCDIATNKENCISGSVDINISSGLSDNNCSGSSNNINGRTKSGSMTLPMAGYDRSCLKSTHVMRPSIPLNVSDACSNITSSQPLLVPASINNKASNDASLGGYDEPGGIGNAPYENDANEDGNDGTDVNGGVGSNGGAAVSNSGSFAPSLSEWWPSERQGTSVDRTQPLNSPLDNGSSERCWCQEAGPAKVVSPLTSANVASRFGIVDRSPFQETDGVLWKSCICDLEELFSGGNRVEWGHCLYNANYHPICGFAFELQWLVATGGRVGELVI